MSYALSRDVRRLLVGVAVASARQRLTAEATVLTEAIDLMIVDAGADRDFCEAYLWTLLGRTSNARTCLAGMEGERALALSRAVDLQERMMCGAARVIR